MHTSNGFRWLNRSTAPRPLMLVVIRSRTRRLEYSYASALASLQRLSVRSRALVDWFVIEIYVESAARGRGGVPASTRRLTTACSGAR